MNIAEQKMEQIRDVFQAAKFFCGQENNLDRIIAYCEKAEKEFRSIAYEAASMQIALKDFKENSLLQSWNVFANYFAKPHAAQVYAGLGWAVAEQTISLETIIVNLPELLRYRIADGCGYYDGIFRSRQTIRNKQLPTYISGMALAPYYQGIGRSLWYISKGDAAKTNELLLGFPEERYADIFRGIGIAVAYVGGSDEATLKLLLQLSGDYKSQFACGVALAVRSRIQANSLTADAELCCCILCNRSSEEAAQVTVDAECGDYFQWLKQMEEKLK